MERHLSTGVATIVALMAATRTASGRVDIPFDPTEDADLVDCLIVHSILMTSA
jgi:hypothetical protein